MSGYVTGWVLKNSEVEGAARLVLVVLADHASSDGTNSWPTVETIQHEARVRARSTVQRALRDLEANGAIRKVGTAGRGQTNWTVVMEGPQDAAGRVVQPQGAASDAQEGPRGAAQTVLVNRPEEPSVISPREKIWLHFVASRQQSPKKLRRTELDPETARMIDAALKVATEAELLRAVDGLFSSSHHLGQNDRGKTYLEPHNVFKGHSGRTTRGQIDLFLDVAEKAGVGPSFPSVDPARLANAKRNVLAAWEMPQSEQAKKAGEMSAAWLAQHGYRVEHDADSGRPSFVREDA